MYYVSGVMDEKGLMKRMFEFWHSPGMGTTLHIDSRDTKFLKPSVKL